jgi:hypothetical protein
VVVDVAGLEPGTQYVFRLCAIDAAGNRARGLLLAFATPAAAR